MNVKSKTISTKERLKILLSGFNEAKEREEASAINSIVSLVEGYKRTEGEYFSASKVKIDGLLTGYKKGSLLTINRFKSLTQGFKNKEKEYIEKSIPLFQNLLKGYFETLKKLRERQRTTAEDINILDVLGFTYDEIRHSSFIAYLFDPLETHAQENLFFKIFLKELGLPEQYAEIEYKVRPGVAYNESIIDIEIISKMRGEKGFIIHIENKVRDVPKMEQIERESRDLVKKAKVMGIPENRMHGFLLSVKNGAPLKVKQFKWIGWDIIAKCLVTLLGEAKAERTRWAAEQYLECIKKNIIKKETEIKEVEVKNEKTE